MSASGHFLNSVFLLLLLWLVVGKWPLGMGNSLSSKGGGLATITGTDEEEGGFMFPSLFLTPVEQNPWYTKAYVYPALSPAESCCTVLQRLADGN